MRNSQAFQWAFSFSRPQAEYKWWHLSSWKFKAQWTGKSDAPSGGWKPLLLAASSWPGGLEWAAVAFTGGGKSADTHLQGDLGEKLVAVGPQRCGPKVKAWVMHPIYCMQWYREELRIIHNVTALIGAAGKFDEQCKIWGFLWFFTLGFCDEGIPAGILILQVQLMGTLSTGRWFHGLPPSQCILPGPLGQHAGLANSSVAHPMGFKSISQPMSYEKCLILFKINLF